MEAKYIRDKNQGKNITQELHDDIETYRQHPKCRNLVFFIYDPNFHLPDQKAIERTICVARVYAGKPLSCYMVFKP